MATGADSTREENEVIAAIAEGAGVRRELRELQAKTKPQFKDTANTVGANDSLIGQDIDYDEDGDMERRGERSGHVDDDDNDVDDVDDDVDEDDNVISFQSETATRHPGSSIFADWQLERIVDAHNRQNPNPITTEQVQNIMQMVQRQDFGEAPPPQSQPPPQLPHGQKRVTYLKANPSRLDSQRRDDLQGNSFSKTSPLSSFLLARSSTWVTSAQRAFAEARSRIQKEPTASAASIMLFSLLLLTFLPAITVGLFAAAATALLTASWALSATFVTASIAVALALCAATVALICAAVLLGGKMLYRLVRRLSSNLQRPSTIEQRLSRK